MSPLLIHLSLALSQLQLHPHSQIERAIGWEALSRWRDLASVLPPHTPVPRSSRGSLILLYALLDQTIPNALHPYHANVATLQEQLLSYTERRDVVIAVLDIIVASLRESHGAHDCLTPNMVQDMRRFAARVLTASRGEGLAGSKGASP